MQLLHTLTSNKVFRYFKVLFVVQDMVILNAAILISAYLKFGYIDRLFLKEVQTVSLLSNIVWLGFLLQNDTYRMIRIEKMEVILQRTAKKFLFHIAIIAFFIVSLKYYDISRSRLLYFYCVFFILLMVSRVVSMQALKVLRARGYNFKNVIIVGANEIGEKMRLALAKDLTYGYRFLGFFDTKFETQRDLKAAWIGDFHEIEEYLQQQQVDEMYVALHIDKLEIINGLVKLCEKYMVRIKFVPDFQLYTKSNKVEIDFYDNTPVLSLRREPLEAPVNRIMKRYFDIFFSLAVILLIFPWLFPLIILAIKLESKGPIFFVQERSGRDNEAFRCLKFRSMRVNTEANAKQATTGDCRVTRVGAILRKTSMDELPQFFNVLAGYMSVVGPRPHMLAHTEQYTELINNYLVRHFAKPGITGWAQISGFRGETKNVEAMKDRVDHDIWYIENWNFFLDAKIIFRTVYNVFKGEENAY